MKSSAIFASNETLSSATKPLKPSATAATQTSFNQLYNKEISNKNTLEATKKIEKSSSPKSEKTPSKTPDTSNAVMPNENNGAKDKECEMAALPTPETNLGIISLLSNTSQFASNILTSTSSETQSQGLDVSITGNNSSKDLGQQAADFDASKLAEKALQTSSTEFPHAEESKLDGKIGDTGSAKLSGEESKQVMSGTETPTMTKKVATEARDAVANSTAEKKLIPLETQFDRTLEAQTRSLESSKELQTAPEPVTSNMQNLAQAALLSNTPEAITATKTALTPHVGANGWDKALGQKVVWMIAGRMQSAELSLNPPDLGPLQVVIKVSNDQASANFFSAQPEVREALESALPRLRQMLNDAGVQLSDFSVGSQASQQGNAFSDGRSNLPRHAIGQNSANEANAVKQLPIQVKTVSKQGLVDTFA
ncbi:flagellar hook-length control protein FliK [Undibacterium parvum]|uniref:Flagellar hook-length control protein FliK n=1 Tax=Undibacterium parvum TaxID=401471 RepID=A0A3Q9BUT5_9BURK|nr:flagellar hook-length control protein FliK [Undibacterium parvum]AZP13891.1 flagellar hook-length control protein FliK [Undibacterium parvum]